MNQEKEVPRSSNFDLFADELIKRCCGEEASNVYDDPHSSYQNQNSLYNKIFRRFLNQTYKEACYLLIEMDAAIKQFQPENDMQRTESEIHGQQSFNHTLLDMNRSQMMSNASKQDIVYKLINYSVFKLACMLERVRRYMYDIVQPRCPHTLEIIEVNLDTEAKFMLADTRMVNIWHKNDFIMCYQVLQIINNEIKRIEQKNFDRVLFQDEIINELPEKFRQRSRKLTESEATSAQIIYQDREKTANDRRLIKMFLQGDQTLGP